MFDLYLKQFTKQYLEIIITKNEIDYHVILAYSPFGNEEFIFIMTYDQTGESNEIVDFLIKNEFVILLNSWPLHIKNSTIIESKFQLTKSALLRLM